MLTNEERKLLVIVKVVSPTYDVLCWTTIALSLAFLAWLALFANLLTPVFVDGVVIKLDLLQTLAFLVAMAALEGTVVVTAINRMAAAKTSAYVYQLRTQGSIREDSSSPFTKVVESGAWIWLSVETTLAILVLRQGTSEACLLESSSGTTVIAIDGWLAAACAGGWFVVVLSASILYVYLYVTLRHVIEIRNEQATRSQ